MAADSLQKYQLKILDLENNAEVAGELGPLQYLSGLTGISMDKIINYLLLVIIFVFDPLAISLVVAANFAFEHAYPKKKYRENLYGEKIEDKEDLSIWDNTLQDGLDDIEVKDVEEIKTKKEFLDTIDKIIYHQEEKDDNGKEDKEEWDELDLNKDGVIDKEEINIAKVKIEELQNVLKTKSISGWRRNKILSEIDRIKNLLPPDEDLTITY